MVDPVSGAIIGFSGLWISLWFIIPPARRTLRKNARRPVSRVLSLPCGDGRPFLCDARHRAPDATNPGGEAGMPLGVVLPRPGRPYSVLLPVGFTLPLLLPGARCALTAPFHPSPRPKRREVCFLWHCPWGRPRRPLAGTVFPWSPDFPPPPKGSSGRPAVWRGTGARCLEGRQGGRAPGHHSRIVNVLA